MSVDQATVRHIAKLARLNISDAEAPQLETELSSIMAWVEQLDEVDTEGVEPMTSVVETVMKMREDVVTDGGIADEIVQNAPLSDGPYFVVPKVVE